MEITKEMNNGQEIGRNEADSGVSPRAAGVQMVSLNKSQTSLNIGAVENLLGTVFPTNAIDKTLTWTTSNANVATVSPAEETTIGTVTAVGVGTAVITATSVNGKYASCTVSVSAAETLIPISSNSTLSISERQNNAKIVFNCLLQEGWTVNAICGAIANFEAESTINPGRWEDGVSDPGYGLAQWTPSTKWTNYADQNNYEHDDIYGQIEYLIYSMQPGRGEWLVGGVDPEYQLYSYEFTNSTYTAYDLAIVFMLCYERPNNIGNSAREYRGQLANNWKTFFSNLGWC